MTKLRKALLIGVAGAAALAGFASVVMYNASAQKFLSGLVAERGADIERGVKYGALDRQALDIYRPRQNAEASPVALFIYGGSWRYGDRSYYEFVGAALAKRGVTVVIPDYRLFPKVKFPAFVEDAALAYRWVSEHLIDRDGQRRPMIIIGHSAGAHIAALLAYDSHYIAAAAPNAPQPDAFIGLSGPYAFDPTTWKSTADIFTAAKSADEARPVAFVTRDAPPSLLIHGLSDGLVKLWNTRYLAEVLTEHGVAVRKVELDGIGHLGVLLAIAKPLRWRAPVLDEIAAFIATIKPARPGQSLARQTP